jgi:hypothetical protein
VRTKSSFFPGFADFYNSLYSFKPTQDSDDSGSLAKWIDLSGPVKGNKPSARINHGFASGDDGSIFLFGGQDPEGCSRYPAQTTSST